MPITVEYMLERQDKDFPAWLYILGRLYAKGIGVETDLEKAIKFFQEAADKDLSVAIEVYLELIQCDVIVVSDPSESER
jgi:TPR repeat protein